jgi:hypothetical protein
MTVALKYHPLSAIRMDDKSKKLTRRDPYDTEEKQRSPKIKPI